MQASYANGTMQVVGAVSGTVNAQGVFSPGGGGAGGGGTSSTPYTITQTVVAVTAASAQVVAANAARRFLAWMVLGTADVTIAPGATAAVVGAGMVYQGSGANKQGASEEFPNGAPSNAFQCIAAAAGSNLIVWEGV